MITESATAKWSKCQNNYLKPNNPAINPVKISIIMSSNRENLGKYCNIDT